LLGQLEAGDRAVIADMEAGVGTLVRMPENSFDVAIVVADSSAKSIEVARRAYAVIAERKLGPILLVANKVREERDLEFIRSGLGVTEDFSIPEDPALLEADRDGLAAFDTAPGSPAVTAIKALASGVLARFELARAPR